jgi:hypothetical protein
MAKRKAARPARGKKTTRKATKPVRKAVGKKKAAPRGKARKARQAPRKAVARKASKPRAVKRPKAVSRSKVPALNRERRMVREDDLVPTPPSSLDLDRNASAARTGRHALHEKFVQHTETSPAITGGDIDADWESAYSTGDEAPGGDNPTPDQDIVDDIGKALGVQYADNEELKGEKKISDRDKKRWELDPASSDDYEDR